jgi:hypothetical protein
MMRRNPRSALITAASLLLAGIHSDLHAQPTTVSIQADQPGKPISPDLFGVFFEDLNYAADGALYGVQNYAQTVRLVERRP